MTLQPQITSIPQSTHQPGLLPETHRVLLQDDNSTKKAGKLKVNVGARKRTEKDRLGGVKNGVRPPRHIVGLPLRLCQPHGGMLEYFSAQMSGTEHSTMLRAAFYPCL